MGIVLKLPVKIVRPVTPPEPRQTPEWTMDGGLDDLPYLWVITGGRPPDDDGAAPSVAAPEPPTA